MGASPEHRKHNFLLPKFRFPVKDQDQASCEEKDCRDGCRLPSFPFSLLLRRLFELVQVADLQGAAARGHQCQLGICVGQSCPRSLGLFNSPLPLPWAGEHPVILSYPQPELRPCGEIEGSEGRKGQPVTTTRTHSTSHASCGALPSPPRHSLPASCSLPSAGQKDLRSGLPGLGLLGLSCFPGHVLQEWHLGPF